MIINPRPNEIKEGGVKTPKRSILGLLFSPHLGTSVSPLRDGAQIFLQLLAMVFSTYKLIPKNYPGINDSSVRLTLIGVIGTAWNNLRFTKENLPQIILFFAIIGMICFSLFLAIISVLSLFVGHAHAQPNAGAFQPESQDVANDWLQYLFLNQPLSTFYDQNGAAIPQSTAVQTAFTSLLAFYSDAILIIAALILFYHLVAMIVETAHHGQVMGKRASQIWAPIRLIVAIGLLVPINSGLNAGQFIVVKMASLGSNLASQGWDVFLNALTTPQPISPQAPIVTQTAADILLSEACVYDYNSKIDESDLSTGLDLSGAKIGSPITSSVTIDGHPGTKYSFSSNDMAGQDVCGYYFIPSVPQGADAATTAAYAAQSSALSTALPALATAGAEIQNVMPANANKLVPLDNKAIDAVIAYQVALAKGLSSISSSVQSQAANAVTTIQPYGWVFAGTFLNTVERIQASVSNAATAGMPLTGPPSFEAEAAAGLFNSEEEAIWPQVSRDMQNYEVMLSKSWAKQNATNVQCAAMLGLNSSAKTTYGASVANMIFGLIDRVAVWTGDWGSNTMGQACGGAQAGLNTFHVGIQINSPDPISQMASLGHANLDAAFTLLSFAIVGKSAGVIGGIIAGAASTAAAGAAAGSVVPFFGTGAGAVGGLALGAAGGALVGALGSAAAGVFELFATIFFACGFTLAYILPLFAFTRFFFAILSWVGAIIEAVIAIPLVALAHLNPEGEGLPGASAKAAYFYIFNIFLRPILCVFGLIAGLMIFYIAVSLLTYTFNLAVAGSGGTAYGHETMSRLIYSVIYVVMMYICANHSFAMIDHVPEQALKWMGASGQSMPRLGEAGHLSQAEGLIASYAGQQMIQGVSRTGDALGQGVQKTQDAYDRVGDKFNAKKAQLDEADYRSELLEATRAGGGGGGAPPGGGGGAPPAGGGTDYQHPDGLTDEDVAAYHGFNHDGVGDTPTAQDVEEYSSFNNPRPVRDPPVDT